ncbi:MAG: proprotein convertase P-domain-containing protein [Acidobacteriota bacterium]
MKTLGSRWLATAGIAVLLTFLAVPALAGVKEDMHAEMISIADELASIKGNPIHAVRTQELLGRYQQLSDALGGDDPGRVDFQGRSGGTAPVVAPVPPNCALDAPGAGSSSPGGPIDDANDPMDTITIAGAGTFIYDVDLTLNITHTFPADLDILLTSPEGTVITVTTDNAGGNDDAFAGTLFDDQAGATAPPGPVGDFAYVNGTAAPTVAPEEALAALFGEDPNGDWAISIVDDAGGDSGTFVSWSLSIETLAVAPIDDAPITVSNSPGLGFDVGAPVSDTLAIAGANTFLCDVTVNTDISHTFAADIEFFLTSPAGTQITMSTDNGGGNDDTFAGTDWFNDGGESASDFPYVSGTPAPMLSPEESFAALIGEDPNGDWVMDVADDAGGDPGTFNSWELSVITCSCIPPETDLAVAKSGVASGDNIIWTIGVENMGPDDATGVVVTDPLDPCTTYISDDCGGSDVPPWTWNLGALPNGAIAFCNVTVDASACGANEVFNTAMVMGNEMDSNTTNQASTASVAVGSILEIPTLGSVGMLVLIGLLGLGAFVLMRRRSA